MSMVSNGLARPLPARALYEQSGFRMIGTEEASWTAPDGGPIVVRRYAWSGVG